MTHSIVMNPSYTVDDERVDQVKAKVKGMGYSFSTHIDKRRLEIIVYGADTKQLTESDLSNMEGVLEIEERGVVLM